MTPIPVVPLRLAEATLAAGDITPVMLFPIGEWKTNSPLYAARYPKGLPLTQETADAAIANFDAGVLGGDVQFSLAGTHNVQAAAAFWVQRLYCAPYSWQGRTGEALWADAKWTQAGAEAANDDQFKYVSVELGGFTTNDGDEVPWVLQGGVMTNYPLIRIMPPVRQGAEAIAASEGERVAEFEIYLADVESYNALRDALEAAIGGGWVCDFSDSWVVYERSWPDGESRTYRAPYTSDDTGITLGQPVEVKRETTYVPADSSPAGAQTPSSQAVAAGKAREGDGMRLAEGDAAREGVETHMKSVIQKLKLAEDAGEAEVLAAVMQLAEQRDTAVSERDTAVTQLAEAQNKHAFEAFELKLAEKIEKDNTIAPGERETYLEAARKDLALAESLIEARTTKVIDTTEHGSGKRSDGSAKRPDVELAERSRARATKDGIGYSKAMRLELAENADLKVRYDDFNNGKEV